MAVKLHSSEYFITLMQAFDIIYGEVFNYFIHHSPRDLVKTNTKIDHMYIKSCCEIQLHKKFTPYISSLYTHTPTEIIDILYSTIFGENGKLLDDFVYQTKGHGWCKRVFPPTDNEMYTFVVHCVTEETKNQFKKMIIL
jgi:hypothetical protein